MRLKSSFAFVLVLWAFSLDFAAAAQTVPDLTLQVSPAEKSAILRTLARDVKENYVFPDVATRIAESLTELKNSEAYQTTTDERAFAALLKTELQKIGNDKHLGVDYSDKPISPNDFDSRSPTVEQIEQHRRAQQRKNFCFQRVERLAGNIGYLDLRCFDDVVNASATAAAAMQFLANTQALIIDLRHNGGGEPTMVAFLISYLFGPQPVHLNDLRFRKKNATQQFWTLPVVPGARMPDKDVWVLTSAHTFSAAEEFTYDLQTRKRATVVGENTRGGANFGAAFVLDRHVVAFIPIGHAVNPITNTNWEGVGVHPDVQVAAEHALDTAYVLALEKARGTSGEPNAEKEIEAAILEAKKRLYP